MGEVDVAELLESSQVRKRAALCGAVAILATGAVVGIGVVLQEAPQSEVPVAGRFDIAEHAVGHDSTSASAETELNSIIPPSFYVGAGILALLVVSAPNAQHTKQESQ